MIMEEHGANLKTSLISSSAANVVIVSEVNGKHAFALLVTDFLPAMAELCSWLVSVRQALIP